MSTLRNHVIRLAHQNPNLRLHLLPLIASTSRDGTEFQTQEASKKEIKGGGRYKKFDSGDADIVALPVLSGKKDVDMWESLIRLKVHDFEPDSQDRKKFLDAAKKQVGYGAFLHRSHAVGKHLKELEKKLSKPEMMKTEMD